MRRSDADDLMRLWSNQDKKIFRYPRPFVPDEYVVYQRDLDRYLCDKKNSTYKLADTNRDGVVRLLINEEIIFIRDFTTWGPTPLAMKTGNCDCGVWVIKDSDYMHDRKCPRYKEKQ